MSSVVLSTFAALFLGAANPPDPIDTWAARLSTDPMWENGSYPELDLPKTASTYDVVAKVYQMTGFPGKGTSYKILAIKGVHIRGSLPDLYTAVLLKTDANAKEVVLIKYVGGWWSRVLDVR